MKNPRRLLLIAAIIFILALLLSCSREPVLPMTYGCFSLDNPSGGRYNYGTITKAAYDSIIAATPSVSYRHPSFKPGPCK